MTNFCIVIDEQGFKKVCSPIINGEIYGYILQEGEQTIETDWDIANAMNKPQWDGENWIDTEPLPPQEPPIQKPDKIDNLERQLVQTQMLCIGLQKQILLK